MLRRRAVIRGLVATGMAGMTMRSLRASTLPVLDAKLPPLRLIFFTDTHAREDERVPEALEVAADAMREVNDVDLVINGGDAIHGGLALSESACEPRFAVFRENLLHRLGRPVEHVIGNHDLAGAAPADGSVAATDPRRGVMNALGIDAPYRIRDVGSWRIVFLDSVELTGGDPAYRGNIGDTQIQWLRDQIAATPTGTPFVLVTHIPFRSTFLQAKESPQSALGSNLAVENANAILSLFEGRQLPIVLQGHLHSNELINWAGRYFIMGGAVSGAWWRGPNMQTRFGFGILEVRESVVSWDYRDYAWAAKV